MSEEKTTPEPAKLSAEAAPVTAAALRPAPVSASRSRLPLLPLAATFVSVLALGAALTQPLWSAHLYTATSPANSTELEQLRLQVSEVADLKAQIARLASRLEQAESAAQTPAAAPVDLTPLERRLAALEARPAPADTSALQTAIASIREEMGKDARTQDAQKTLMVASMQLVTAWQTGQPFEAPWLAVLAAANAADPALALELDDAAPGLLAWRDKGIPRLARLTADYPAMAQSVVAAMRPAGQNWWEQSLARLKGLVVIRRQADAVPAEDTSTDAVLARAEARLNDGDLPGTVAELEKLNETATLLAGDWLEAARARLQADALSAKLTQRAAGGLLAGTAPNASGADDEPAPGEDAADPDPQADQADPTSPAGEVAP